MRKFYIFISAMLLSSCVSNQYDFRSISDMDHDLKDIIRGNHHIPSRGVMVSYYGPFGWSSPEFRFIIDENHSGLVSAKFLGLKEHISAQTKTIWSKGIRNEGTAYSNLQIDAFSADQYQCKGLTGYYENVWKQVLIEIKGFKPEFSDEIRNDGGSKFIFHLSNGKYKVLSFTLDDKNNKLVKNLFDYLKIFKTCANKS